MNDLVMVHNGMPEFDLTNINDYLKWRVPDEVAEDIMERFTKRLKLQSLNNELLNSCASFCKQGNKEMQSILPNGSENADIMVILNGGTFFSQCVGMSGYGPNEYILRKIIEAAGQTDLYVTDMYKCIGQDDACIKHYLAQEIEILSPLIIIVDGMNTYNKLIEHNLIKCSQTMITYGNLYDVTLNNGSSATMIVTFEIDKLYDKDKLDYTKYINSLWGQIGKIGKVKTK